MLKRGDKILSIISVDITYSGVAKVLNTQNHAKMTAFLFSTKSHYLNLSRLIFCIPAIRS